MKNPPHLPPQSSSINLHRMYMTIEWMLFVTVLGLIAGIAGAFVAVAWLLPTMPVNISFFSPIGVVQRNVQTLVNIDPLVAQQVGQRIVSVYDGNTILKSGVYTQNALVGHAIFVSSDGWLALYAPHANMNDDLAWRVIDNKNIVYKVIRAVQDSLSGIVYLKINGSGFRVTPFLDAGSISIGNSLWAYANGSWQNVRVDRIDTLVSKKTEQPIWKRMLAYNENPKLPIGTLLVDSSGSFVGFVGASGDMLPSFYINNQISSLLTHGTINYTGIGVYGYPVQAIQSSSTTRVVSGWYVTKSRTSASKTTVGIGDIIEKINGQTLAPLRLAEQILGASGSAIHVTVFRNGEESDILVPVVSLKVR